MGNCITRKEAASARQSRIRAKSPKLSLPKDRQPRFIADVMLGRLAKWLRIAGFDVLYSNKFSDDELISIANREGRILLSRDTRLLARKSVRDFIFLESQDILDQIEQTFEAMQITYLPYLLSRCLCCNEILAEICRETVRSHVPAFVYRTHTRFKYCPKCGKIFWPGTHRSSVVRILEKLLQKVEMKTAAS